MKLKYIETAGDIIFKYRTEKKESQEEFASNFGLTKGMISFLESGKREPTSEFLESFFKQYKVLKSDREKIFDYFEFKEYPEEAREYILRLNKRIIELEKCEQELEDYKGLNEVIERMARKKILYGDI